MRDSVLVVLLHGLDWMDFALMWTLDAGLFLLFSVPQFVPHQDLKRASEHAALKKISLYTYFLSI